MNEISTKIKNVTKMTLLQRDKFETKVSVIFGLFGSEIEKAAIEHNLREIKTFEEAMNFISFAESEMHYLIREEEIAKYQRYNRLEKFSIIARKFNRDIRVDRAEFKKQNKIAYVPSKEEQFKYDLEMKIKKSVSRMRAVRDEVLIKKEYYKIMQRKDCKKLGLDEVDYSILLRAIDAEDDKKEVDTFLKKMEEGSLKEDIKREVNKRILNLQFRKTRIIDNFDTDTSFAIERIEQQISDLKSRSDSLFSKMEELYAYVYVNRTTDWVAEMKGFEKFKITNNEGVKVEAFSDKEKKALEVMGGWDEVIKIHDQGRFRRELDKAFENAKQNDVQKLVGATIRKM